MKKLLAMVLSVCICSSFFMALSFAEENGLAEKVSNTLIGCEVLSDQELETVQQPLTRKEAAKTMIRLLDMDSVATGMSKDSPFLDVPADDPYAPYIILCAELGIIGGDGNGHFRPEDSLTQEEGVKLLVSCLGYESAAQISGGYPSGYLRQAQSLSLFRGVPAGGQFTKAAFYTMVYNTLQEQELLSNENASGLAQRDDESLLERLMERKKIVTGQGVVIGNVRYALYEELSLNPKHVKIGEETFLLGEVELPEFLGRNVTYYAKQNQNDEYVLTHVFKARQSREMAISKEDEPFWQKGRIGYLDENGRENFENLADGCSYIYNGRPAALPEAGDVGGEAVLVDHDGDGNYDLAIVNEEETRRVSYLKPDKGVMNFKRESWYLASDMPVGLKELDQEDKDRVILLENSAGEPIALSDIAVDDIVTVAASKDGKHVYIRKEENAVSGAVTSLAWDSIGVDGEEYAVAQKTENKNPFGMERLGLTGTFYLNDQNQIIYFAEETGIRDTYGYIAGIATEGAVESEVRLKLVLPGRIRYFEEPHDDGTTDRYLKAVNDAVEVHQLKEKLSVDGRKEEAGKLVENGTLQKGMVIRYDQNSEGLINKITLPKAYYEAQTRSDLRRFVTFSDGKASKEEDKTVFAFSAVNKGGFKVSSEETAVFCVPPLPGEEKKVTGDPAYSIQSDDDYFDNITMNNDTSYYTRAYDFEEDTGMVRVFMIVSGLNANRSDDVLMNEPWSILQSKQIELDEDGEFVYTLNGFSEGKSFRVQSLPGDANGLSRQLEDLMTGDVFKFIKNTQGRIYELCERDDIFSIATDLSAAESGFFSRANGNLYGKVSKIERKIIDESTTRYAHLLDVDYGSGTESINASYTDTAIYIYDTKRKTVEAGTEEDIYSTEETGADNGSMIFAKVDDANHAGVIVIVE